MRANVWECSSSGFALCLFYYSNFIKMELPAWAGLACQRPGYAGLACDSEQHKLNGCVTMPVSFQVGCNIFSASYNSGGPLNRTRAALWDLKLDAADHVSASGHGNRWTVEARIRTFASAGILSWCPSHTTSVQSRGTCRPHSACWLNTSASAATVRSDGCHDKLSRPVLWCRG